MKHANAIYYLLVGYMAIPSSLSKHMHPQCTLNTPSCAGVPNSGQLFPLPPCPTSPPSMMLERGERAGVEQLFQLLDHHRHTWTISRILSPHALHQVHYFSSPVFAQPGDRRTALFRADCVVDIVLVVAFPRVFLNKASAWPSATLRCDADLGRDTRWARTGWFARLAHLITRPP